MTGQGSPVRVDIIIMSNMGRSDGGRETWCYTMLPRWLAMRPDIHLRLHYMHIEGQADTRATLDAAFAAVIDRFEGVRHVVKRGRLPMIVPMLRQLRAYYAKPEVMPPTFSFSLVVAEMILQTAVPKLRRRPMLVWLRTIYWDEKGDRIPAFLHPLARRAEAWLLARARLLLGNGDDIASYYARYGLTVEVVRNGVEIGRWALEPPAFGALVRIAFIGRLSDAKGIKEFLHIAKLAAAGEARDRLEFHVCGIGPHAAEVTRSANADDLIYHGEIANEAIPDMLAQFDICVALTRASDVAGGGGTSNAMMEQMAAGRLILAWDNRIFRQYLDESNALMIPQDDTQAATAALAALTPERAQVLAAASREAIMPYRIENQLRIFDAAVRSATDGQ